MLRIPKLPSPAVTRYFAVKVVAPGASPLTRCR